MNTRHRHLGIAGLALAAALALSGCSGEAADEGGEPEPGSEAATAFLACLTSKGVDARINDQGMVLVRDAQLQPVDGDSIEIGSGSDTGALLIEGDDAGNQWVAAASADYFAEDPDTHEAYAACEREHPSFEQPAFDPAADPEFRRMQEEQTEAALAFAQCARENGEPEFPDPDPEQMGGLMLPDGMTEDGFRAIVEACYDGATAPAFIMQDDAEFEPWVVLDEFSRTQGQ